MPGWGPADYTTPPVVDKAAPTEEDVEALRAWARAENVRRARQEAWQEGWNAGFRDAQDSRLLDAHMEITPRMNPYAPGVDARKTYRCESCYRKFPQENGVPGKYARCVICGGNDFEEVEA